MKLDIEAHEPSKMNQSDLREADAIHDLKERLWNNPTVRLKFHVVIGHSSSDHWAMGIQISEID